MPGRLIMEQQSPSDSRDRNHAHPGLSHGSSPLKQDGPKAPQDLARAGHNAPLDNKSNVQDKTGGRQEAKEPPNHSVGGTEDTSITDVAPNLDQSWRDGPGNKSMGVLIQRLAQQCYTDLNETLTRMSETPMEVQANGVAPRQNDISETSLGKKRMFMEFANGQRDRFIKTLVLSDWARNGEDMARLVDIKVWQERQDNSQRAAIQFIGITKHDTQTAKMPSPNIEGALEFLATGQASHVPDMGYIPPKRLTARQLLKTLRNMNVTLVTRLNLSETVPLHFANFNVANGRATFHVPDEFEVDLSVADEDETSPFYFIDFRFLFGPSSNILNENLRAELEGRTNALLASTGLQGCYEFLHNFVLTHKIHVMRNEAIALINEKWFDCLRVDKPPRGRALVVQYWASLSGPKSWIEIGVATGKKRGDLAAKVSTPELYIRWVKEREVQEEILQFDQRNLSVEKLLSTVIAKHITSILQRVANDLRTLAGTQSQLKIQAQESETTPSDCFLALQLSGMREPMRIQIEPMTGRFFITPTSLLTVRTEQRLHDAKGSVKDLLAHLLCRSIQDRVMKTTALLGWSLLPINLVGTPPTFFGDGVLYSSVFRCSEGWDSTWAVAATFGLDGQKWWTVRYESKPDGRNGNVLKFASAPRRISFGDGSDDPFDFARESLLTIERLAVAEISYAILAQQLSSLKIPHRLERLPAPSDQPDRRGSPDTRHAQAFFFKLQRFQKHTESKEGGLRATDVVRLTTTGATLADGTAHSEAEMCHELRLSVEPARFKDLRRHLSKHRNSDIALDRTGALAIKLRSPFGKPFYTLIEAAVTRVERLDEYWRIISSHKCKPISASLSKLTFGYGRKHELKCTITSTTAGQPHTTLDLEPKDSNPHQRIRIQLEHSFTDETPDALAGFTRILLFTLPLLRTLEALEHSAITAKHNGVRSYIHRPGFVRLDFRHPLPPLSFDIILRSKPLAGHQTIFWQINLSSSTLLPFTSDTPRPPHHENLLSALRAGFFQHPNSTEWFGLGTQSVLARPAAIPDALNTLHAILVTFSGQFPASEIPNPARPLIKPELPAPTKPAPPPPHQQPTPAAPSRPPAKQKPPPPAAKPGPAKKQQPPASAAKPPPNKQPYHAKPPPLPVKKEEIIELLD